MVDHVSGILDAGVDALIGLAHVAQAEAAGEEVLLMDVDDIFQDTPIGNNTQGEAVVKYYNAIGYDFAVPGNEACGDCPGDVPEQFRGSCSSNDQG